MTKHRWKGTMKSLGNHLDPEKEEQLKWVKIGKNSTREHESLQLYWRMWETALKPKNIQFKSRVPAQYCYPERGYFWFTEWQLIRKISNKVKRILKLAKNMNPGNKDGNLKKRAELINLVEDFHLQYESLYSLYGDLKVEVKKNVKGGDDDDASSSTSSDSETFYSPGGSNVVSAKASESESSDFEDTILKDKLTSTSEVKKSMNMDSVSSYSKPPEFREIVEDLRIQGGDLEEKRQRLSEIKDLEKQVASLKLENVSVFTQKKQLEEEVECKANEAVQMKEKISKLEAQIKEIVTASKENERRFSSHKKIEKTKADKLQFEVDTLKLQKGELEEKLSSETKERSSSVNDLLERVDFLQKELVSVKSSKAECELELKKKSEETSECLLQIETLRNELTSQTLNMQRITEQKESNEARVKDLELKFQSLSRNKRDLGEQKESNDARVKDLELEIQFLSNNKRDLEEQKESNEARVKDLELEIQSLSNSKRDLEEQIKKTKNEASQSNSEKKKLHDQVKVLEDKVENLQNERKSLRVELDSLQNQKTRLETDLEKEKCDASISKSQMEKKNTELTNKIADQQKTMLELGDAMNKIKDEKEQVHVKFADPRSNLNFMERKIEEMAGEFRKQFEDKYRILSRRIRVAEQLHVENKEWYIKTKESYEQQNKELKQTVDNSKLGFKNVKDLTLSANDVLTSLDSVSLKFEECSANFLNRISKASCELKFAKDWAMRKNKALLHVKDDLDCLLRQLDGKEAEILVYREKVWKSENKIRELEKMVKGKEDGMLGLEEEKREAIRQLCVWIDYHRSRSDYYKKMMSEMNPGRRKA